MTLRVVPQPQGLTFRDWADTVVGYNPELLTQLSGDMDWHEFGNRLSLVYATTPDVDDFTSWEDWVAALRAALQF